MPYGSEGIRRITESIEENDTAFDTRIADNTTNRIDASGTYPFNVGRHQFIENGRFAQSLSDATDLTDLPGKMQITAGDGDEHIFGARELVRYVPNYELLWGSASWAESELQPGQHFAPEFSNEAGDDGYRVHYEGTADGVSVTLEQYQASNGLVDSRPVDTETLETHGWDHTKPHINRGFINWYGAGLWRHNLSYPIENNDGETDDQRNVTVGRTSNQDDVATDEINLNVQVRVWADAGAPEFAINVCSIGALIRGNATQRNREKSAVLWGIGGSISQYPADNVADAVAARIDPARREVAVESAPPIFEPNNGIMGLTVFAVHKDDPDLSVDFTDPDDDGTSEGANPGPNGRGETDVMQYTRSVSSIPTEEGIRADGTEGTVPAMRELTTTIGDAGGNNSAGTSTGGEQQNVKRLVFPDDVVIFLPRTDPASNVTDGTIRYLKTLFDQDW